MKEKEQENRVRPTAALIESNEDREIIENVCFPLWEQWISELVENGDAVKLPAKIFAKHSGATESSPTALMFAAFCGGVDSGVKLTRLTETTERSLNNGTGNL